MASARLLLVHQLRFRLNLSCLAPNAWRRKTACALTAQARTAAGHAVAQRAEAASVWMKAAVAAQAKAAEVIAVWVKTVTTKVRRTSAL